MGGGAEKTLSKSIVLDKSVPDIKALNDEVNFAFLWGTKKELKGFIALFNNMRTVQFKAHHAKFVLLCRQSYCGPLRKQVRYFKEVNRSRSWFMIGGFRSILLVSAFG